MNTAELAATLAEIEYRLTLEESERLSARIEPERVPLVLGEFSRPVSVTLAGRLASAAARAAAQARPSPPSWW